MINPRILTTISLVALVGCSSDSTQSSDAMKAIIENCAVPVSMEVRVSANGTEFGVRCDAMKQPVAVKQ